MPIIPSKGGITTSSNYEPNLNKPLDNRLVVNGTTELKENITFKYPGLTVWDQNLQKHFYVENDLTTWNELVSSGGGSGYVFIAKTDVITIGYSETSADIFQSFTVVDADRGTYFLFEVVGTSYTNVSNIGYIITLPIAPDDGFSIIACIECAGSCKFNALNTINDELASDLRLSTGCTYLITYSQELGGYLVDEFYTKSNSSIRKIEIDSFRGYGNTGIIQLWETSITYYLYKSGGSEFSGNNNITLKLPPSKYNTGKKVKIAFRDGSFYSPYQLILQGYTYSSGPISQDNIIGLGTTYTFPNLTKRGSYIELEAAYDGTSFAGWIIISENIIL